MRLIQRTDDDGYKRLFYIKDNDPDTTAGIPANPPDLQSLDWDTIIRSIHNGLVEKKLIHLNDVRRSSSGLDSVILSAVKRPLIALYRSEEND